MSNEIEDQIVEDVEEKELIESEVEVSEETEVTEPEQTLSNTVLDVLLGEAKKKNEAEEEDVRPLNSRPLNHPRRVQGPFQSGKGEDFGKCRLGRVDGRLYY